MKQSLLKLAFAAVMLMLVAPFAGSQAVAQTHNLTGTVVDAQGNPVAGAAVVIDGTTKGTSTGSDGSFALNGVMANQSLLVTFIGYEPQTVAIGSQTNMKVVLKEDNQTLDEVVVIGYGVQKKRDVTGSITSVKSDVFESRSVENAQQALQGKAPGVQVLSSSAAPGSSPFIRTKEPFSEAPFLLPVRRKKRKTDCISSFCKGFDRFPEPEAESKPKKTVGWQKSGQSRFGLPKTGLPPF